LPFSLSSVAFWAEIDMESAEVRDEDACAIISRMSSFEDAIGEDQILELELGSGGPSRMLSDGVPGARDSKSSGID
jgi:hypothetical protein